MNQRSVSGIGLMAALAVVLALSAAVTEYYQKTSSVAWVQYSEAFRIAATRKKPVYVDFYADWCQPCKVMDKTTFASEKVISHLQNEYIVTRVNVDDPIDGKRLSDRFQIRSIPTSMVMTADGNVVKRTEGYMDPDQFLQWLAKRE